MRILLLLLVVVGGAVAAVEFLLRKRRRATTEGPSCGHCGYSTIGLTTLTCPECGSDLRKAGIVLPGGDDMQRWGFRGEAVRFTVVFGIVALILGGIMVGLMPQLFWHRNSIQWTAPASKAYAGVSVVAETTTWRSGEVVLPVAVELQLGGGQTATLKVDPRQLAWEGAQGERFEAGKILEWMRKQKIDAGRQEVRAEANCIALMVRRISRPYVGAGARWGSRSSSGGGSGLGKPFGRENQSFSSWGEVPAWASIAVVGFWVVIYVLCLRMIRRYWRQGSADGTAVGGLS